MRDLHIIPNGFNGATGSYAVSPLSVREAADIARGEQSTSALIKWYRRIAKALTGKFLGLPDGVDATSVSQAGWAVVFPSTVSEEIKGTVEKLVEHRRRQILPGRCKILVYAGENVESWLRRYGVGAGSIEPTQIPYYLLLIGSPEEIPFEFQYQLAAEYAVGRLAFETADEYRQYITSIIGYETEMSVPNYKKIAFWATRHNAEYDATRLSADYLVSPLCNGVPGEGPTVAKQLGWDSQCFLGGMAENPATKSNLLSLFRKKSTDGLPAMLFAASHGVDWVAGDERQRGTQGALLCQDWPGPGTPCEASHFVASQDLNGESKFHGAVAFLFACHGGGTPQYDDFLENRSSSGAMIAKAPFVASLPQRMLAHPNGSALAVIGHVDRAWGYSILSVGIGPQLVPFRNLLRRVLDGSPVGYALKPFSERYAILSTDLLSKIRTTQGQSRPTDEDLVRLWVQRNDAQNYILLGDPAARIRVDKLQIS